ncbi:MAG: hypothetical protein ACOC0Q_10935 [Wenzhouxiangella sp.]
MALVKCKECKKEVSNKAETCPHCGAAVKEEVSTAVGCLVVVGLVGLLGWYLSEQMPGGPSPDKSPDTHDTSDAWVMCQVFAERRLRAPRTAKWPLRPTNGYRESQDRYRLQGHVDAENAFGAMIRSQVLCVIEYTGAGQWRIQELEIN